MRCNSISAGFLVAALATPAGGASADPVRGGLLYGNHCTECHTSVVHVRERRKAATLDAVRAWITRWERERKLGWSEKEVTDVLEYLDSQFYRFGREG